MKTNKGITITLSSLLLHASLFILCVEHGSGRKTIIGTKKSIIINSSSKGHHMTMDDPSLKVFFTPKDLKIQNTFPIYFPAKNLSHSPRFLTREESDSIPFSSSKLPFLLDFFSFPKESPQAKAIEYTLKQCELEPIQGETRFCVSTLESMLDFTSNLFGPGVRFRVLTTTPLKNTSTQLQNYTISGEPKEVFAPIMLGCHTMPYPYAVFYCHSPGKESENKVFQVSLLGANGERVEAVAICHMDTSRWDRDHLSFRVLGIEPRSSPVCHFFPWDNLVWVPLTSST
ncbi:BURP domain protein USPL1 [Cannabis sativa]|uniref:BURP domain protein USPL1 n=1 Tax=Cannabis sativa TaxID=3483 RepID=UPI0029CA2C74|nr:BURP domain protein USPL1 [Cannabis sativa]